MALEVPAGLRDSGVELVARGELQGAIDDTRVAGGLELEFKRFEAARLGDLGNGNLEACKCDDCVMVRDTEMRQVCMPTPGPPKQPANE